MTEFGSEGLVGTPSDEASAVLDTGRSSITTMYVSMSQRHPEGDDARYLKWHTLDHRPEQYRLASVKAALRFVSTPLCREVRAASDKRYDGTDHLMTYFFADIGGLGPFADLAVALKDAGRIPYLLPSVERGAYQVEGRAAAPRIKLGADVLPWWPSTGLYLLIEEGKVTTTELLDIPGVAGIWSAQSVATGISETPAGLNLSYCFLDADPVDTAASLKPVLQQRWQTHGIKPLLAAPFQMLVPREWDRHLPQGLPVIT